MGFAGGSKIPPQGQGDTNVLGGCSTSPCHAETELWLWVHKHPTWVIPRGDLWASMGAPTGPDALLDIPRPWDVQMRGLRVQLGLDWRLLQLYHAHGHLHVQQRAGVQRPRLLRLRQVRLHPARLLRGHLREVPHVPGCLYHQKVSRGRESSDGPHQGWCPQVWSPPPNPLGWDPGEKKGWEGASGMVQSSSRQLPPLPQGLRGVQEVRAGRAGEAAVLQPYVPR